MLEQYIVESELLNCARKVWVQFPNSQPASTHFIFLDGELYIDRVKAPGIVGDLQASGQMPPVASIFLSNVDAAARHADFTCNERFSQFLAAGLPRWIEQRVDGHDRRYFLIGLSLSGLSAAFTALRYPSIFSGVVCQSPSAWWNDERLSKSLPHIEKSGGRFWISVGDQELQQGVSHPPSNLFQKTSQLDSVRRLSRALESAGHKVCHTEFSGGHDPKCWATELPQALKWLLNV